MPVRSVLSEAGDGRVLVVNVKESGRYKFAVLGDNVAQLAADNNWAGIVINGCVRDTNELRRMDIGIKAVGVNPLKTHKIDYDEAGLQACKDLDLDIGGVQVKPRMYLAADADGVIISDKKLV